MKVNRQLSPEPTATATRRFVAVRAQSLFTVIAAPTPAASAAAAAAAAAAHQSQPVAGNEPPQGNHGHFHTWTAACRLSYLTRNVKSRMSNFGSVISFVALRPERIGHGGGGGAPRDLRPPPRRCLGAPLSQDSRPCTTSHANTGVAPRLCDVGISFISRVGPQR
ncbi:hypothetical protein E2C01_073734 [Portunus trituberculatus]|uniref:Uncharacterized protein n=1 Tax=Portunus trituberculatus TaxID=210409 RepID=A0A5B7IEB0_PORTR|nr:hypothetical protein [Portunus trituberculatus]